MNFCSAPGSGFRLKRSHCERIADLLPGHRCGRYWRIADCRGSPNKGSTGGAASDLICAAKTIEAASARPMPRTQAGQPKRSKTWPRRAVPTQPAAEVTREIEAARRAAVRHRYPADKASRRRLRRESPDADQHESHRHRREARRDQQRQAGESEGECGPDSCSRTEAPH